MPAPLARMLATDDTLSAAEYWIIGRGWDLRHICGDFQRRGAAVGTCRMSLCTDSLSIASAGAALRATTRPSPHAAPALATSVSTAPAPATAAPPAAPPAVLAAVAAVAASLPAGATAAVAPGHVGVAPASPRRHTAPRSPPPMLQQRSPIKTTSVRRSSRMLPSTGRTRAAASEVTRISHAAVGAWSTMLRRSRSPHRQDWTVPLASETPVHNQCSLEASTNVGGGTLALEQAGARVAELRRRVSGRFSNFATSQTGAALQVACNDEEACNNACALIGSAQREVLAGGDGEACSTASVPSSASRRAVSAPQAMEQSDFGATQEAYDNSFGALRREGSSPPALGRESVSASQGLTDVRARLARLRNGLFGL